MNFDIEVAADWARSWLADSALLLWWERGADRVFGGFFDKLGEDGAPLDIPKRVRVQARQIYVYAQAVALPGQNGMWTDAVAHGLDFMISRFRRPDGLYRAAVTRKGKPVVEAADLYDQAFVMFALASAYRVGGKPRGLLDTALDLLDAMERYLRHASHGFEEAVPRALPLRANPHMHLLEALLAWIEVYEHPRFVNLAQEIVQLAIERLIDGETGAIGEYFDGNWQAADGAAGRLREPGHQYEWASLIACADRLLGGNHRREVRRLIAFAETHGVRDGCVIMSVDAEGGGVDDSSRLWGQTERLRAALTLPDDFPGATTAAEASFSIVRRQLETPKQGLWWDRLDTMGRPIREASPASSLYHIMTGLAPLFSQIGNGNHVCSPL